MRTAGGLLLVLASIIGMVPVPAWAGDWPMWRRDARRSAACPDDLAPRLHLQWVHELPPTMLAWPNESRLHFDVCYEPVVLGKNLLIGSPNEASVTALDTETGRPRWKFFAEGPVRFAPIAWKEKVYFGCDDGYLYCLNLRDGRLRWKVRGAPDDRPERRHLGNNRLVSFWPIRGGPVLADGTICFGAGLWPTLGVFVVAVDAESGNLVWRNTELSRIEKVRLDHNVLSDSGLSPQGYLAVEGDTLLVPNGRSMPAGLDRKTGKLLFYIQGYRNGECQVTVMGKYAFVGRAGVVSVQTGREVGSRWAAAGAEAPQRFDGSKFHLFEGPIHPYKLFAGCSARSALAPGIAFDLEAGTFTARDLDQAEVKEYESKFMGRSVKPWRWDPPTLWTLATEVAKKRPNASSLIKAGSRLYGHTANTLIAVDLPTGREKGTGTSSREGPSGASHKRGPSPFPAVAWTCALAGTPGGLLAADGKLFAVTQEGKIACFAPGPAKLDRAAPSRDTASRSSGGDSPLPHAGEGQGVRASAAAEILRQTRVCEGYCVVLGLTRGDLLDELLDQSNLKIFAVDADREKVNALRRRLVASGRCGTRVELFVGDPLRFDLPPCLASLIVSEDAKADLPQDLPRLFEMLRPYGGMACWSLPPERQRTLEERVKQAGLENAEVERAGSFALLRRAGPLAGSAPWTHESADPARTFFSQDQRVKPPLEVLWYGDGPDYGFFKTKDYGTGVKPQVVGGRVFALQIHSNTLQAYDAYTGRLLWKNKVDPFTRYASLPDGIYVAGGGRCAVLEPATGQERASFKLEGEAGQPAFVADIRVDGDLIVVAVAPNKVRVIEKGLWDSTMLLALDRKTGKLLWQHKARERFNNNALALGAGMVFAVDSLSPIETERTKRRGQKGDTAPSTVLALDARSGQVRWTKTDVNPYRVYPQEHWLGIQGHDDWLAYCRQFDLVLTGKQQMARALEAATGREVWSGRIGGAQPWMLRGATAVHQGGGVLDVRTGKPTGTQFPLVRGGCNYAVAGEHMLFLRSYSVRCIDAQTGQPSDLFAVRSGCSNSLVAADGLLSVPCFAVGCVCNYPIQTSFAMIHVPPRSKP